MLCTDPTLMYPSQVFDRNTILQYVMYACPRHLRFLFVPPHSSTDCTGVYGSYEKYFNIDFRSCSHKFDTILQYVMYACPRHLRFLFVPPILVQIVRVSTVPINNISILIFVLVLINLSNAVLHQFYFLLSRTISLFASPVTHPLCLQEDNSQLVRSAISLIRCSVHLLPYSVTWVLGVPSIFSRRFGCVTAFERVKRIPLPCVLLTESA